MKNEFLYKLRIHIEDTDFGGVVYHSNYLNFMQRARSEWFETLGLGLTWQSQHRVYFPVREAHLEYLKPARIGEMVEVVTRIKEMKKASIIFEQHLRPAADDYKILCKAEIKLACVDETMRPRALPHTPTLDEIRRTLT